MSLDYKLKIAKKAVLEAAKTILYRYDSRDFLSTKQKADGGLSTHADEEAEICIRDILLRKFPGNGFVGEQKYAILGRDGFKWYCDAIDGTHSFINGEKTASTSLALTQFDKTILAIVYNPFTNELFSGAAGGQCKLNGYPIPRFNRVDPSKAVYNIQISADRKADTNDLYSLWEQKDIGKLVSTGGSVAYSLALVAQGVHSSYISSMGKPYAVWDTIAGIYLIESVGGKVSFLEEDKILIASTNAQIHQRTLDLLAKTDFGKKR